LNFTLENRILFLSARTSSLVTTVALIALFLVSCGQTREIKEIKLAHGLSEDHAVHKGMLDFAERVKSKSDGALTINIYPNGILGSESQCLELLQIGSLGITKVSAAVMESFAPKYKVLGIPYVFNNDKHRYAVYDGEIGSEILNSGKEFWLKGLCFYDAGSRSFYTTEKAVRTAEDLSGMRIRVMRSITANKMISQMGGSPVPIDFGELYTALQQGVVDGAENNPPSFHLTRHYEICKYYTLDKHTSIPDVLLISTIVWDQLSDEQRQWVQEAAIESVPVQRKFWTDSETESLEAVKAAGIEVIEPDLKTFQEATSEILEEFKENEELRPLIEEIRELGEKYN
jgi:tripartite ATP-independent transporter DctP family solute receptor